MTFREKLEELCEGIDKGWSKETIIYYLVVTVSNLDAMQVTEIFDIAKEKGNAEGR